MEISQLYVYPIKSLRSVPLSSALLTPNGFPYDRRFLLLKDHSITPTPPRAKAHYNPATCLENMTITCFNELALFTQEIHLSSKKKERASDGGQSFTVTYTSPVDGKEHGDDSLESIELPLEPNIEQLDLKPVSVDMHGSPTRAYIMPQLYNRWFSTKLGWDVLLAYLGPHRREVLGNIAPSIALQSQTTSPVLGSSFKSWFGSMNHGLPNLSGGGTTDIPKDTLTFSDIAPYLVVTEESLTDVSSRLPDGMKMDITKFRPNIVLRGASEAWEEDFWGEIRIEAVDSSSEGSGNYAHGRSRMTAGIILTSNCGRCVSINVDYMTGRQGAGEDGKVLKKLMRDRRVDPGNKYSPIFGRYGFLKKDDQDTGKGRWIHVGSTVEVSRRNEKRTIFDWPGIGS